MGETVTKVLVDGEEFLVMIQDGSKKFTCRPSKKYKFLIKKATKLSSPELTMVKPKNNQSASKE
jgi:hypothetical protein